MKRHGHKSKFKHFAAGAALALLVVAAAPAGADYFAQVTGSFGGGETMGAPTGGSSFGGGMTGGSQFGGGMTGGSSFGGQQGGSQFGSGQQGGMTSGGSQQGGQQMGGQNSGQQPGTGKQMGGTNKGSQMGSQQGGSNKGGSGTFPGSGSTEGKFPGGGATGGTFPGGQSSFGGDFGDDFGGEFGGGEFDDKIGGSNEFSMSKKGGQKSNTNKSGMTKGGQGSKMGGQKGGQSSFGYDFDGEFGGGEFYSDFGNEFSDSEFGMVEDNSKAQKGKTTKSYGSRSDFSSIMEDDDKASKKSYSKKSYGSEDSFDMMGDSKAQKGKDTKSTGKKSYGSEESFGMMEDSKAPKGKTTRSSDSGSTFDVSSITDLFKTSKSAGKRTEFVLEEEDIEENFDFDVAAEKALGGNFNKIKTAKKLQTTIASRAESIYIYVCSEDNGFDCEGDKALSKAITKLEKELIKPKANVKTLKKNFKAFIEALRLVVEGTDEWEDEE